MRKELLKEFDNINEQFDFNGIVQIRQNNKPIYKAIRGYRNLETKDELKENDYLPMNQLAYIFSFIALIQLLEKEVIKLDDSLGMYLDDLPKYKDVTISQLIKDETGLANVHAIRGLETFNKKAELGLSDIEFNLLSARNRFEMLTQEEAIALLVKAEPAFAPGVNMDEGATIVLVVIEKLVEKILGVKIEDYALENYIKPLKLDVCHKKCAISSYTRVLNSDEVYYVGEIIANSPNYLITMDSFLDLINAIINGKLLRKSSLKKYMLLMNSDKYNCLFSESESIISLDTFVSGYELSCSVILKEQAMIGIFYSVHDKALRLGPSIYKSYDRSMITNFKAIMFTPNKLKLVPINSNNGWSGLELELTPKQEQFVSGPRDIYCHSLICSKEVKQFILIDGKQTIGLVSLEINKKHNEYYICNYMIDYHYQGMGYGKQGIKLSIDYLKAHGAKKIFICFRSENIVAQKCYESQGFKCIESSWATKMVYDCE